VLNMGGEVSKQTLSSTLGLARSTVDEVTRNLREAGLLVSISNGVAPTLFASLVWETYESLTQCIAAIGTFEGDTVLWPTEVERQRVIQLVAARLDILETAQTPHDKRDLVADLSVSRSTVDRALRELEIVELMAWTSDGYVATTAGKRAAKQYRVTIDSITDIIAAQEVLTVLPNNGSIQPSLLTDATVECSAAAPPYHLPSGVRDRIVAAERVRVYLPVLATPQLLDCCQQQVMHEGLTLDLITSSSLFETLSAEFPGPLGAMAAVDHCTAFTADTASSLPPFGLVLAETGTVTTMSVIAYDEHRTIHGTIHNRTADAVQWAEEWFERIHDRATDVTDTLRTLIPIEKDKVMEGITMSDTERIALESEGFVRLTPAYFAQRAPAPPMTGWRTGFTLVDVHAGYAINRERARDGTRYNLTDSLIERLEEGTNLAVLDSPGSGKSTVCKSVACRWYEQGAGPVFYREGGRGTTVPPSSVLSGHLRAADGHALVVVEDAVRAEANAIFQLMRAFRGTEDITFLLDAREQEWDDPEQLPIDAGLEAYRHEAIETVSMPTFDDSESERLVQQFEQTTNRDLDNTLVSRCRETTVGQLDADLTKTIGSPGKLLLFLHRLVLSADPLVVYNASTPTSFVEDVQRTYDELRQTSELAVDVGVFVNLLNATGIGFDPALVCTLATTADDIESDEILNILSTLEGRILFARDETGDEGSPYLYSNSYHMIHEEWSALFLDYLLDAEGDHAASRRVGRCVTSLLSLADDTTQRDQLTATLGGSTPAIERITDTPCEWADTVVEQLYNLGLRQRGLAPLFGTTDDSFIDLPESCSQSVTIKCTLWRAKMFLESGKLDSAERECETLADLVVDIETTDSEWAATLRGRRLNGLGIVAWHRSKYDRAKRQWTRAIEYYRKAGNKRRLAQTHGHLGGVAYYRGDTETAEASYIQSLEMLRDIGHTLGKASALSNLGTVIQTTGRLTTAIDYYRQSLDITREIGDRRDEARELSTLGLAVAYRGDLHQGEVYCMEALELAREAGDSKWEAVCLEHLGQINLLRGDFDIGERYCWQSLDIRREFNDKRDKARSLINLGLIAREKGAFDTAIEHCTASHEMFQEVGARIYEARSLTTLGTVVRKQGDCTTAAEHARDSLELHQETGDVRGEARCYRLLGRIAHDREQFTTAENYLTRALSDVHDAGYRYQEAETHVALGSLAWAQTDATTARERFEDAVELYHDIGAIRDTVETVEQLAAVCEALGDSKTALARCEMAHDLAQDTDFVDVSASLDEQRARLTEQLAEDDGTQSL
jgi:tetratricopeptide (TPR) repeat protein/predicted transcriptional regulator